MKESGSSTSERMLETAGRLFAETLSQYGRVDGCFANALYRAVFEKIVRDLKPVRVSLALVLENQLAAASEDRKAYAETVTLFVSRLVDSAISPVTRWRMRLIKREIEMPTDCFQIIMEGHINVIHDLLGILVSKISGESPTSENVRLEAMSILAICLQYALNEEMVKARMGWTDIGPREIERIKTSMAEMVLRSLNLGDYIDRVRIE